ncbi:hypothetical protein HEB94_002481 [Actinopolymorpha pittospori]|uniref:Uncharacterized protein n=1 Tax=Actinopolymorpha pittospori TaxID=648752 RepID=A0A927MUS7_9ACTN|nr:hypothetical protein [Actinopolymorpha pittospori]
MGSCALGLQSELVDVPNFAFSAFLPLDNFAP